jgi:RNAse (barnase) inhibitor barstar
MRIVMAVAVAAAAAGCAGGVTREEMDTLEQKLKARDDQVAANLRSELTGVDRKFSDVQQLHNKVEQQLAETGRLVKELQELKKELSDRVNVASGNVLKSLEFEERMMSQRLAELRLLIEEIRKPAQK